MILRSFQITALSLVLAGCSMFGVRTVEEAPYTVISSDGDIELREYSAYVSVETIVEADFENAGNRAFGRLFGYISGENTAEQSIDMTAPVISSGLQTSEGESIDMTAPVIATMNNEGWRYAFVLPADFTLDSAPRPLRDDVELVANAPRRVAAIRFSGSWRESRFEENAERLQAWLADNRIEAASGPSFAGYDPPWTIPMLRRNEILVEIEG